MSFEKFEIRDRCRANFNKFTRKAFKAVPKIDHPYILDLGCGTGVPTIELAKLTSGEIHAIDSDKQCLAWFKEKIKRLNLESDVIVIQNSVLKAKLNENYYDIILAEGLLNIVGFEKGLRYFAKYLKSNGYFLIHDDSLGREKKRRMIEKCNFQFIDSFNLDEKIWWNDYYSCLQKEIDQFEKQSGKDRSGKKLFAQEKSEIRWYKKDPSQFRSTYYILKKN